MDAPKRTIDRARTLRRAMTPPELRLWVELRGRKHGGLRFRRQHPFGPFILDFYGDSARLCVQVDGEGHGFGDTPRRDAFGDRWLRDQGVRTVRIAAVDVRDNLDGVVQMIVLVARGEWEG
ncbi:endonuclease domain-containing protein [Caulobacter sp. KR2-114]|uniref:endonuclease domain-containing protein n=1 Tax=Caulobacter sp. KR2-114 TaxID=3400912 RepID=UPI003C11B946